MKNNKSILKIILIIVFVVSIALLINKFNVFKDYGPNEIKDFIQGKGIMAPVKIGRAHV